MPDLGTFAVQALCIDKPQTETALQTVNSEKLRTELQQNG